MSHGMYPQPSNLFEIDWGSLWFLARIGSGPWTFYETCAPAVITQLQQLLRDRVSPTETTLDGQPIGPAAFETDGVVGLQTLRRMWVLANMRGAPTEQMRSLTQLARTRPANAVITPWLMQLMLWLTYPDLGSQPYDFQLSIAAGGAPSIGSSLNLPVRSEAQARALPGLLTAKPTGMPYNAALPPTSIRSLEALRNTTQGTQTDDTAPWTVSSSPIGSISVTGNPYTPVFTPTNPQPQSGTNTQPNLPPVPTDPVPEPQPGPSQTPDVWQPGTPTFPPQPQPQTARSSALGSLATNVTAVGKAIMPALPYLGVATVAVLAIATARKLAG